ncbi:MAG: 2,5-dihydroxypyridine 5,6-dioxygenase [Cellvibrionaceae bacterium]|jgi:2,5-dihydroxypyridine 5,6-dioxygenase
MLRERIEGKWIASFRRVLTLNGVTKGSQIAIVAETQSRPVLVELAEIACYDLGADYFTIVLPTPEQTAPVVVRSTGSSDAIQHKRPVIEALKAVDAIVDVTVEGLIHAAEMPEIHATGTRLIVICNEHPEILERTEPYAELGPKVDLGIQMLKDASWMKITSKAGTDLMIDVRDAPCGGTAGFSTEPASVSHWPGGLCLCFPKEGAVNGIIVMDVGDMNLTFKKYMQDPITLIVENDFVTSIDGDNLDGELFRSYLAAWDDPLAYGFSHVGWGMNPKARWDSMALYDKKDVQSTEFRAFAGNFLFSTGSNQEAGRFTLGHFDLPLRNCTIELDGVAVVKEGVLQGDLA